MVAAGPAFAGGQLGRYELHGAIARGGMATVYVARMSGAAGFTRTVAVKRLHPHLAADPTFTAMFVDEARLAARIRHPNVVDTLDVVAEGGELFLVMAFVLGETLSKMVRAATTQGLRLPASVVSNIVIGALEGLHAAHEARSEQGEPLGIVHRDVSPQNILVGVDGVARVIDFGVAKSAGRLQETEGGELKGKLAYMAPEQLTRRAVDRRCDVFAMGVVLWEALTSRRLFAGDDAASTLYSVVNDPIPPPSTVCPDVAPALDSVVLGALQRDPSMRFQTAREMALALEAACPPASARQTGEWVEKLAAEPLRIRGDILRAVEQATSAAPTGSLPHGPDDIASIGPGSGGQRTGSGRLSTMTHTSASGISGVSMMTGTSGVTSSGYSDPSHATRVHPVEAERRLPLGALLGICTVLALMLATGLVTGIKALTQRTSKAKAEPALATTSSSASSQPALTTADSTPGPIQPAPTAPAVTTSAVVVDPPPTVPATGSATATTSATVAVASPRPSVAIVARPQSMPTARSAKSPADCENPFTVDANGVKRPKPHCFAH